jgi:hypothetical protein
MKSPFASLLVCLFACSLALAQSATPNPDPSANIATNYGQFTLQDNVVGLGAKGGTMAATDAVLTFNVTTKIALRSDNLLVANGSKGYFGGLQYQLPTAKLLAKSNFDPATFGFYLAASGGEVVTEGRKHPGFLFHGVIAYDPTRSGKFSVVLLDAGVARLPYVQSGVAAFYSAGIKFGL